MKTVRKDDEVIRVRDVEVKFYRANGWSLCPKSVWKAKREPTKTEGVIVDE